MKPFGASSFDFGKGIWHEIDLYLELGTLLSCSWQGMNLQMKPSCNTMTLPCIMNHFRIRNVDLNKKLRLV